MDQGHRTQATFFPISRGRDQIKIDLCIALTCRPRLLIMSYIFPHQSGARSNYNRLVPCFYLSTKVTDHELHFSPSVGGEIKLKQTCFLLSPVDQGHRSRPTIFSISRRQDQIKIDSCIALTYGSRSQITSYIFPHQSGARSN